MQKLALSKKIMEAQDRIPRGQTGGLPMNETNVNYNIPNEYLGEPQAPQTQQIQAPVVTEDRIKNSKLPDHIKQLMIEHPIEQSNPMMGGSVLSEDVIAGATRLMGNNKPKSSSQPIVENSDLKQMIRDVVRDTVRDVVKEELQKAGMISEGTTANETLQLRVGSHIFEGKVTKIKKLK